MTSTASFAPAGELLKTDCLGRVRTPRDRRDAILDEFERSGASGMQFAALLGIKYPTFANWVQQRRRRRRMNEPEAKGVLAVSSSAWVEAVVDSPNSGAAGSERGLRMELPGGVHLEMTHAQQAPLLASLLRALQPEAALKGAQSC